MKILAIIEAVLAVIKLLVHLGIIKAEDADKAVTVGVKDALDRIAA